MEHLGFSKWLKLWLDFRPLSRVSLVIKFPYLAISYVGAHPPSKEPCFVFVMDVFGRHEPRKPCHVCFFKN